MFILEIKGVILYIRSLCNHRKVKSSDIYINFVAPGLLLRQQTGEPHGWLALPPSL